MKKIVNNAKESYKRYSKIKGILLKWWRILVNGWQINPSPIYKAFFFFSVISYFIGFFTVIYTPLNWLGVFGVKDEGGNYNIEENVDSFSESGKEIEFLNSELEDYSNPDKDQSVILNNLLTDEERNLIKSSKIIFDDSKYAIKLTDKAVNASPYSLLNLNDGQPVNSVISKPFYAWQSPESDNALYELDLSKIDTPNFFNFEDIDYSSINLEKIDLERNSLFRTYPHFPTGFNDSEILLDSLIEEEIGRDIEYKVHGRIEMDVIANNNLEKKILNFDIILAIYKNNKVASVDDVGVTQYSLKDVRLDSTVLYCEGNGKVINSVVENCT